MFTHSQNCFTVTHQSNAASNHSHPALFSGRLDVSAFVMKCIEGCSKAEIWKFIYTYVSYITELSDWRQRI